MDNSENQSFCQEESIFLRAGGTIIGQWPILKSCERKDRGLLIHVDWKCNFPFILVKEPFHQFQYQPTSADARSLVFAVILLWFGFCLFICWSNRRIWVLLRCCCFIHVSSAAIHGEGYSTTRIPDSVTVNWHRAVGQRQTSNRVYVTQSPL